ncbi:MAG: enoyl-CoA hydratase [Rhodobacteraceae bacterium PARR1]|nr:MAG: enoyl-CoA hydratase [Rhodobacteraceae bacterium PARR1]
MSEPLVLREDQGAVAVLTMNAPARLNALSNAMIAALADAFDAIAADDSIRAVVLRGEGRAFCAGHDLREIQAARDAADGGEAAFATLFANCAAMMQKIPALPQPVIAQVQGIATAAGCQLAASCDLIVAATDARFGVNGVNIGLFCATPMVALTRKVAPAVAFEMLTTGEFMEAPRAQSVGLVNRIAPVADLDEAALTLARSIASKLPAAIRLGKAAFHAQTGLDLPAAYAKTGQTMVTNLMRDDTSEGITAFIEKRPPTWG